MIRKLVSRPAARLTTAIVTAVLALAGSGAALAWEPTKPVEFVVPAGTGGGADQMARLIQGIIVKHKLMKESMVVVNKSGGAGAEGFLSIKEAKGDPHKIIVTLSNLFTTPMATGVPFNWKDMTPVAMMALDQFVLWVNADTPYKTAQDLLAALKQKGPNAFKLGGTGSKQEDQLISVLLETAAGTRIQYVPLKGGGDVAKTLAAGEVDLTVNNPIEAESLWRSGKLRPLCVFDGGPLGYPAKLSNGQSWNDIPTCMSAGIPAQYLMLRGFFMTPQATPEQVAYYVQLLAKVRELPEWREFMAKGAFRQTAMSGAQFVEWLDRADSYHRVLMREAKLMAK